MAIIIVAAAISIATLQSVQNIPTHGDSIGPRFPPGPLSGSSKGFASGRDCSGNRGRVHCDVIDLALDGCAGISRKY